MKVLAGMKRAALCGAAALLILSSVPCLSAASDKQVATDYVVVVNDSGVSRKGYERALAEARRQFERLAAENGEQWKAKNSNYPQKVLEQLIDLELLYQDAVARGISVDDAVVDKDLEALRGQFKDEVAFAAFLEDNGMTEKELKEGLKKDRMVKQLHQVLQDEMMAGVKVTDQDIKEYYEKNSDLFKEPEQVKVNHILVAFDKKGGEKAAKEARKKIEEIQKQIKDGKDFLELARTVSDAPNKEQAGELGYFPRGMLVKDFEDAAFALKKPGDVSGIVESPDGYHLIRLQDHKPAKTLTLDEEKDKIRKQLTRMQVNKQYNAYLEGLRSKAKITRVAGKEKSETK
jgi:parvulin-like peptidyl-prolyl isomerase